MPQGGYYFDTIVRQPPIDETRLRVEDNLEEFVPIPSAELERLRAGAAALAPTGLALVGSVVEAGFGDIAQVPAPFLKRPRGIRDIEEWYVSTLTRRPYIHRVFERQTEIALANLAKVKERVGDRVQAVFICGTDFGTQTSQFCSPAAFRELYLPYYRRVNDWVHRNTAWKTFKHSCGAVEPLIPLFIEAGFDILNPVQVSAAGMDAAALKAKYGRQIVFWGGGVDTQKTLAFGTPEDVRAEVLRHCEIFGRGGGFVFNAIHNIQANVPIANVVAMFNALKEYNGAGQR